MRGFWLAALFAIVAAPLAAAPPGSILFMTSQEWRRATAAEKTALAADFMRIFCAQAAMPPAVLVDCLDRSSADGALFERALACVRQPAMVPPVGL
jgi:hypothetical protein